MAGTITKTDIAFDELRLYRELQPDGTTYKWYVTVGYRVVTAEEGEDYQKSTQIELTATQKTRAKTFLTALYDQIKAEEGIA